MKHIFQWLLFLVVLALSCNTEELSEKKESYRGRIKSLEVQSFHLRYNNGQLAQQEITDSLPAWLPVEEYAKQWNEKGVLQKHLLGKVYSAEAPDTLIFSYNEKGQLSLKSLHSVRPSENRSSKFMYNGDGQYNAINVLTPDQELDSVFMYNYDSQGVLHSINEFHNQEDYQEFVPSLVRKYFYPVKNLVREDFYPKNPYTGKHYYAKKITNKYKKDGRLFEKIIESGGKTTYRYEYDRAGQLLTVQTYDNYDQLIEQTKLEYDDFGNIVLKSFQADVGSYSYQCAYTYDEQQNWITKKITLADDEEASFLVTRTFSYWE